VSWPRASAFWVGGGVAVLAVVGVANMDVTTQQGFNFEVSTHRLPLYLKALQFIDRSAQYEQIAEEITHEAVSDTDRVLRIFEWSKRRVRDTPRDWPVVDDHILHIIIRGHGMNDQQADVFATLATYAGIPTFWAKVSAVEPDGPGVIMSFARVDGRWRVFDVFNRVVFRLATGDLATMDDLRGHPELVPAPARVLDVDGLPYADFVAKASMPDIPSPLRAELQMPLARMWYELKRVVGFASRW
jgi:hypothetical protein